MSDALSQTQREAILDAATASFTQVGYEASSLEEIASRCGLPAEAVAQHFPDKGAVRKALLDKWSELLSAWVFSA